MSNGASDHPAGDDPADLGDSDELLLGDRKKLVVVSLQLSKTRDALLDNGHDFVVDIQSTNLCVYQ